MYKNDYVLSAVCTYYHVYFGMLHFLSMNRSCKNNEELCSHIKFVKLMLGPNYTENVFHEEQYGFAGTVGPWEQRAHSKISYIFS